MQHNARARHHPWPNLMDKPRPRRLGRPKTPKRQPRRRRAPPLPAEPLDRVMRRRVLRRRRVRLIYPTIYPYLRELGAHPTVLAGVAAAAFRAGEDGGVRATRGGGGPVVVTAPAGGDRVPRRSNRQRLLLRCIDNRWHVVVKRAIVGLGKFRHRGIGNMRCRSRGG